MPVLYTKEKCSKKVKSLFSRKKKLFQNSFSPAVILEWNKIDVNIRHSASCNVFKKVILKFVRPELNQVFNVDSSEWLKFLTIIRLALSHLAGHKFRHNFQDCVNPICSCGQEIDTSTHFLLHCSNYHYARRSLFERVNKWIQLC